MEKKNNKEIKKYKNWPLLAPIRPHLQIVLDCQFRTKVLSAAVRADIGKFGDGTAMIRADT
jgi:hypothetical protein